MQDHWEMLDVYKALMAVAAGVILGLERELKDKVAGLKTITIICLGATLFGILSYKLGGSNPTQIAAYVVSGVGFLGAGAIFKDGSTVSGLTTAGIIWLAAAVGLAIGFGEFYLAATFMGGSMLIILSTPFINKLLRTKKTNRALDIHLSGESIGHKEEIIQGIREAAIAVVEKKVTYRDSELEIVLEVVVTEEQGREIQQYLLINKYITSFSF